MSDKPAESTPAKPGKGAEAGPPAEDAAAAPKAAGSFKAWLPLLATVLAMPVLAWATTHFLLLPKVVHAREAATTTAATETPAAPSKNGEKPAAGKTKVPVPLTKLLVNVAGTMGTRYLMTSVTLVGNTSDFKAKIEDNKDQLMDLATGALSTKTISDLEKPGARNQIRSELLNVMNNALGGSAIQEIYITELAIQ